MSSAATVRGVSAAEIAKFRALQQQWWNPQGPLRSLHLFNPVRVQYIAQAWHNYSKPTGHPGSDARVPRATQSGFLAPSVNILDVGCGGGILAESLARLGATVTGIDMCEESVAVAEQRRTDARANTVGSDWVDRVTYRTASLFDVVAPGEAEQTLPAEYDLVVASEVIEHVSDARGFLSALCQATKPGGMLVLSTMDKSIKTFVSHILLAEQLTGVVTPGTHDWRKFIPPSDMTNFCARPENGITNVDLQYVLTYPDLFQTVASRNFEVNFALSRSVNSGHYFWAGTKPSGQAV